MRKTRIDFVIPFVFAYGLGSLVYYAGEKLFSIDSMLLGVLSFIIGTVIFFLIRYVLIASGLCPPLFPLRFLPRWKRFISYYGIIYYDENVEQIFKYYNQKNYEAAALEFSKLTNTDIIEARNAINLWDSITGEGIL